MTPNDSQLNVVASPLATDTENTLAMETRMDLPWWSELSKIDAKPKRGIARYVAGHLIRYGTTIQVGPGTTPLTALEEAIALHVAKSKPLDIVVLTTALQIYGLGRRAQRERPDLFNGLQIVLTGGLVNPSMQSAVGDFAALAVSTTSFHPEIVMIGVYGISFDDGLRVTYHFPDEVTTQAAYANRPTNRRLILCSGTKFGVKSGCLAPITVDSLLEYTNECIFVSMMPDDPDLQPQLQFQVGAFKKLLQKIVDEGRFPEKNLCLRMVNVDGEVQEEWSLHLLRTQGTPKRDQGNHNGRHTASSLAGRA